MIMKKYIALLLLCGMWVNLVGQNVLQESPIDITTRDGITLKGTVIDATGQDAMPTPLVVIVAGSGATDRDGNGGGLKSDAYKMLCESLAERGISSYRYDKRAIAASAYEGMKEEDLTVELYAGDVKDIVHHFYSMGKYSSVYVVGHSEGSLLSILAARDNKEISGVVSLCGAGRPMGVILKEQLAAQAGGMLTPYTTPIIDSLSAGHKVKNVMPQLYSLFRPSVQPFLISQMRYDPVDEIKKLTCPILIISGSKDLQVKEADYDALRGAKPDARAVRVEGMSHTLKMTDSDNMQVQLFTVYMNPSVPLSDELMMEIKNFVK